MNQWTLFESTILFWNFWFSQKKSWTLVLFTFFLNVWTDFEFINIFWLNKHFSNRRTFLKKIGEHIFIFIFVNGYFFQIPEYVLITRSFFQNHEHDFISRPFFPKIVIFYNFMNSFAKTPTFFESAKLLWFSNIFEFTYIFMISQTFFEKLQLLEY